MRIKNSIIAALFALAAILFCLPAGASTAENPSGYNAFGGVGKAQGTTNSFFVAGDFTLIKSTPIVRYLNVSSDLAGSAVQFYVISNKVVINNPTNSGTTNLVCTTTNGYNPGDVVLIKHVLTDTYERLTLETVANTNQIVTHFAPAQTCTKGDWLALAKPAGSIPIGAATNSVPTGAGMFLYAGQYGQPLLIEIKGTSTAAINAVAGDYK